MVGYDPLLRGAARLARLYQTLAAVRRRGAGTLSATVQRVPKMQRQEQSSSSSSSSASSSSSSVLVEAIVRYESSTVLPGPSSLSSSSTLKIVGQDRFLLEALGDDDDDDQIKIVSVTQEMLDLGEQSSRFIDSAWLTRQVVTSIDLGEPMNWFSAALWNNNNPTKLRSKIISSAPAATTIATRPKRSDRAALTIYRVMEALHEAVDNLFDPTEPALPPAAPYLAENIVLRGYVDEPILQGRSAYIQALTFPIASLRTAVQSGAVSCQISSVRTEFTAAATVQCTLTVSISTSEAVRKLTGQQQLASLLSTNVKIELVSEYRFGDSTGLIEEQLLRACRVNGVLTPADVLVRFLRNRQISGGEDWLSLVRDSFQWSS